MDDDSANNAMPAEFSVLADGKELWHSGAVKKERSAVSGECSDPWRAKTDVADVPLRDRARAERIGLNRKFRGRQNESGHIFIAIIHHTLYRNAP